VQDRLLEPRAGSRAGYRHPGVIGEAGGTQPTTHTPRWGTALNGIGSEQELVSLALALGARDIAGVSDQERDLLRKAPRAPELLITQARTAIARGRDPLGDAFSRLRSGGPDDRAWFVSTDIDLASTYVGGSRVCIDAILSAEEVEALPASIDDPLGVAADTINPSTASGST